MPKPFPSNILTSSDVSSGPGQGVGRAGPPGPPGLGFTAGLDLAGNALSQSVVGFRGKPVSTTAPLPGQVYVFNGTQWNPETASGRVPALSRTLFVDAGTAIPSLLQDGSIGFPFSTLTAAFGVISASPLSSAWHVVVGPGEYVETAPTVGGGRTIVIEGPSKGGCLIQATGLGANGINVVLTTSPTTLVVKRMTIRGQNYSPGIITTATAPYPAGANVLLEELEILSFESGAHAAEVRLESCEALLVQTMGTVMMDRCDVDTVDCLSTLTARDSRIGSSAEVNGSPGTASFTRCTFAGPPFSLTSSYVILDGPSNLAFNMAEVTRSPDNKLRVVDRPGRGLIAQTNNATPLAIVLTEVPLGRSMVLDITVAARLGFDPGPSSGAGFRLVAGFKNPAGTAIQVGATSVLMEAKDDPSWDFSLSLAGSFISVVLTGDSGNPVTWAVSARRTASPFIAF